MKKIIAILFLLSPHAQSEILFEGFYKVSQFKKHIGFVVQRNEIDPKTKNFKTTSILKLAKNGFDTTESLQAISDGDLRPVSYTYMMADGIKTKTIDATFDFKSKEPKMNAVVTESGEKKKINKKITKDTFLSSALYYFMLKSKTGIKVDTKYDFTAIAEEVLEATKGSSVIQKKLVSSGPFQFLKSQNKFAGSEYSNLLNDRGEVFSSNTEATGIEIQLVKSSSDATEGVKMTNSLYEKIFGDVPAGQVNQFHR